MSDVSQQSQRPTAHQPFVRQLGEGSPVLCLHASTSSSRQWDRFADLLSSRYSVVTPDLYGYGKSPHWNSDRRLTLQDEINLLEPVLRSTDKPWHVIGHSFGGAVATALAVIHPERVRSLVLYEPVLFGLLKDDEGGAEAFGEITDLNRTVSKLVAAERPKDACHAFIDYWSGDGSWASLDDWRQQRIEAQIGKVVSDFDAVLHSSPTREQIAGLEMPVLLMSGALTRLSAGRVAEIFAKLPRQINTVEFSRLGHMGPVTHPDLVNKMIAEYISLASTGQPFDFAGIARPADRDHRVA